jgi:hypothetical protein
MFSKGTTWPPIDSTRTHASSGSNAPAAADRQESGRSRSESPTVPYDDGGTMEAHWEAVIDRATD